MKKFILLIAMLMPCITNGNSQNQEPKYILNSEGDAYMTKTVLTSLSFENVCSRVTAIISDNFVNNGAGVSLEDTNSKIFTANYVFLDVQRAYPLVMNCWSVVKITEEDGMIVITQTYTNYQKQSNLRVYPTQIRISNTQPLNAKGSKFGFNSHKQMIKSFNTVLIRSQALMERINSAIVSDK